MKNVFAIVLFFVGLSTYAHADQCLDRRDIHSYDWISETELDVYADGVIAVMRTTTCTVPLVGSVDVSFHSATGDLYKICPGDRVDVSFDGEPSSHCQILSLQSK